MPIAPPPIDDCAEPARSLARRRPVMYVALAAVLLACANVLGFELRLGTERLATMWPPAGVILVALMFSSPRLWPWLCLLSILVEASVALSIAGNTDPWWWSFVFAIPLPLQSIVGALLLRYLIGERFSPTRFGTVLGFLGTAMFLPILGASMGALGVAWLHADESYVDVFQKWWYADTIGILVMVPLLAAWGRDMRAFPRRTTKGGPLECVLLFVGLVGISMLTFGGRINLPHSVLDVPLLVWPFPIWALMRFGPRTISLSLACVAWLSIREAIGGEGPFFERELPDEEVALMLQGFLVVTCGTVLLLAASVSAWKLATSAMYESQRRLDLLTERINAVLWVHDPRANQLLFVSRAYERVWGRPLDELYSDPLAWRAAIHPEDQEIVLEALRAGGGTQRTMPLDMTFRILRDGEVRWIWSRSFPLRDESGQIWREVGNATDITHQHAAEEQQRELERQLMQSQKMEAVGQLASGVAHDLNNVLTVVQGHAQILADPSEGEEDRKASLLALESAVDQARNVTRSLLTFARSMPTEMQAIDMCSVVAQGAEMVRRTLPTSIALNVKLPNSPLWLNADRTQMQQVLLNLAINARDAIGTERGEIEIRLTPTRFRGPREPGRAVDAALLTVSDSGHGMSADVREHLFEPFFTTKERGQGTGLGLAVVLGIVRQHDGTIDVVSAPGEGARFEVRIPSIPAPEETMDDTTDKATESGAGERLLLAEDSDGIRDLLVKQLGKLGFEVDAVSDGDALTQRVQADPNGYRLWICDLDLPKRTGLECLQDFRANGWQTPALLITGDAGGDIQQRLDEHTELVLKPFSVSELVARIAKQLEVESAS